ncbi:peptidoglycan-binding domain-containing protein [Thermoanaerobacter sp. A7A]|nr:peptidoglycan-binding domain-containing protein [Thermoanaerobacter sp. A7A]
MYALETGGSYKTSAISSKQSGYLSKGSRGEDVKAVQQVLNKLGYSTGGVDGIFGKNTDAAIKAFQKANGLTPDGIIGPQTLKALIKAANSISSGSTTSVQQKTSTYTKPASTSYTAQNTANSYRTGINANKTYQNSSTTPVIYDKNGSTTPIIAGRSSTPKLNILAGQINGSTIPQNYKIYDKNGNIITNQQNTNAITVAKNFGKGMGDAVVGTLKGVWTIATHPAETVQGIAYVATHPAETVNTIKNEAIKTYNKFKTGDANTRAKIAGRVVGEIAIGLVGTKGLDKGIKAAKEATVIAGTAKTAETAVDITKAGKAAGVAEKAVGKISKVVPKIESTSVKETAISPSKLAQMAQGKPPYPGIDRFRDITLKEGKIIYRGEPNGTEFFTTESAIRRSEGDAEKLFKGLQVEKHREKGYRKVMVGYKVTKDTKAAFGIAKANVKHGEGGLPQIFVPNVKELEQKGILVPVKEIPLKNYK